MNLLIEPSILIIHILHRIQCIAKKIYCLIIDVIENHFFFSQDYGHKLAGDTSNLFELKNERNYNI